MAAGHYLGIYLQILLYRSLGHIDFRLFLQIFDLQLGTDGAMALVCFRNGNETLRGPSPGSWKLGSTLQRNRPNQRIFVK